MILFASLGGISWSWKSRQSVALALGGIVLTLLFLLVEHRAKEPVIPLKLFRLRVFQASSAIGFVMGFAMFGAVTFLPLFLQDVKNVSPTLSGLRLFPLMFGLFGASIISGRLVTRWGRYKIFPILGTACMTLGAFLLSLIGIETSALGDGVLHVRIRSRARSDAAGAGRGGAERGLLRRSRRCDIGRHVLPHDRRVVRDGRVRGDLRQCPRPTSWSRWSLRSPRGPR